MILLQQPNKFVSFILKINISSPSGLIISKQLYLKTCLHFYLLEPFTDTSFWEYGSDILWTTIDGSLSSRLSAFDWCFTFTLIAKKVLNDFTRVFSVRLFVRNVACLWHNHFLKNLLDWKANRRLKFFKKN